MPYSREEAVKRAIASSSNVPDTCQLWTRTMFGAPSAGDRDTDGDADAVDGWLSEPQWARHPGDRNPPRGVPVAWSGGRKGYGHRAISLGNGKIRSTDAGGRGKVATVDLSWVEKNWGLKYLGWSETITGQKIPHATVPPQKLPLDRGKRIEAAIDMMREADKIAKDGTVRDSKIKFALKALKAIPRRVRK